MHQVTSSTIKCRRRNVFLFFTRVDPMFAKNQKTLLEFHPGGHAFTPQKKHPPGEFRDDYGINRRCVSIAGFLILSREESDQQLISAVFSVVRCSMRCWLPRTVFSPPLLNLPWSLKGTLGITLYIDTVWAVPLPRLTASPYFLPWLSDSFGAGPAPGHGGSRAPGPRVCRF